MPKKAKLKKWTQVYPQGTKEGDEEQKLFIGKNRQSGLVRHSEFDWRSTEALVKESGLSRQRVEEIINKYVKMGLVFPSPHRDDHWGYWERDEVFEKCVETQKTKSIGGQDKSDRIDDHLDETDLG